MVHMDSTEVQVTEIKLHKNSIYWK